MRMPVDRRQMLLGSGLFLMTLPVSAAREALKIPQGAGPLPAEWIGAPSITLWDGLPPGSPRTAPKPSITLDPTFITGVARPEMRVFRPKRSNGQAILTIPGGAYTFVSIRNEGTDVARTFTELGYTVFVLVYRLPGEGWANRADVPLQDAQRAMRLIKSRAGQFSIDPDRISVIGFSAGGHLAASLITAGRDGCYDGRDAADQLDPLPSLAALIYPVISTEPPYTHQQSVEMLLGPNPTAEAIERRSPARRIGANTPPTFLVHALDDVPVPSQNSLLFLDAMQRARRPVEIHLFEEGGHGFGIGPSNAPAGQWPQLLSAFIARHTAPS
ncbi:alpha/beta hydrolase [Novosphingobium subterraneum]|uniref:alpha/beta hydrolase n=1 Tax=Novosphingobium subterraneum TaxID=48936 RepID=UPI003D01E6C1